MPATHAYACWLGFTEATKRVVARLFKESHTAYAITIVQHSIRCARGNVDAGESGWEG